MFTALPVPRGQDGVYLVQEDRRWAMIAGNLEEDTHLDVRIHFIFYNKIIIIIINFILSGMLTSFSESPRHLLTRVDAEMLKKVVLHSVATAFASSVLPVPGGPCKSILKDTAIHRNTYNICSHINLHF